MAKQNGLVEQPEMETPNTQNSEVQMSVQTNTMKTPRDAANTRYEVQPNANNYATSGTKNNAQVDTQQPQAGMQQQIQQTMQTVERVQTTVPAKVPSDFYDNTVQGYLDAYNRGVQDNDYQAQINALNALDIYRQANGYKPIYAENIYELTNKRVQKIKAIVNDYDNKIASAINVGDTVLAEQLGQELNNYKISVNYTDTLNNSATYLQNVEYKNQYDSVIDGIVNELLTLRFTYDPSDDKALAKAQEHASNVAMEKMNAKGLLDSSMTAQIVTSVVSELEATYEKMARDEFYENVERLKSMANFVIGLEETQYNRWLANVEMNLQYYQAQKDEIAYQWDRVNQLGYVDNEASIILGVAPGTLSPAMRQAIMEAEAAANKKYNELTSDIALAEAKAKIELQTYAQKKAIEAQYKTPAGKGGVLSEEEYTGTYDAEDLMGLVYMMKEKYSDEEIIKALKNNAKTEADYIQALAELGYTTTEAENLLNPKIELNNNKYSIAGHMQTIADINRTDLEYKAVMALNQKYPDMTDEEMLEYINKATNKELKELIGG